MQFAAEIRMWRKPEPYKGKGINRLPLLRTVVLTSYVRYLCQRRDHKAEGKEDQIDYNSMHTRRVSRQLIRTLRYPELPCSALETLECLWDS